MIRVDANVGGTRESEALHVLRVAAVCGLVLSAYGPLPWLFRAVIAVLTGRALIAGVRGADGSRRRLAGMTVLYIVGAWAATFAPVVLLGNPDFIRTSAAAAALVLLLRELRSRATLALSAGLLLTGLVAAGAPPHAGPLGELGYVLGATWPRDWGDVSSAAGLVLLGSAWAKTRRPTG